MGFSLTLPPDLCLLSSWYYRWATSNLLYLCFWLAHWHYTHDLVLS
jgi:hypothetical protein